jgi:hypothetical protein
MSIASCVHGEYAFTFRYYCTGEWVDPSERYIVTIRANSMLEAFQKFDLVVPNFNPSKSRLCDIQSVVQKKSDIHH